ncbi:MAG: signal peptidase I [Thermosphaera sp.]
MKNWVKRLIQVAYIVLITWFSIGSRILPTPLGLFTVSGFSMYPSLKPGDLVVGVSSSLTPISTGDIVIYCKEEFTCIVHRLVQINATTAVTKGDYNPSVDPPIPVELIRFKVVSSIPLIIWLPLVVLSITLMFFPIKPWKGLKQAFVIETFVFLALLILDLAFLTIYVIQTPPYPTRIVPPDVALVRLSTRTNSTSIVIDYASSGLNIVSIEECVLVAKNIFSPCSEHRAENNQIVIQPPDGFYEVLLDSNLSAFIAQVKIKLDKGVLLGRYPVVVEWNHPVFTASKGRIIAYNPSPGRIEILGVRLRRVYSAGLGAYSLKVQENTLPGFTLEPFETREISVSETSGGATYVEVSYVFARRVYTWVGKLEG